MKDYSIIKKYKIIILNLDSNKEIYLEQLWSDLTAMFDERVNKILITAESDVFSENQAYQDLLCKLFERISGCKQIKKVIIDSELEKLNSEEFSKFKTRLSNKELDVEIYTDSIDKENIYYRNQTVSRTNFENILEALKNSDINIEVISTFGSPTVLPCDYQEKCLQLALYAFSNGVTEFVISPFIYKKDEEIPNYIPVSHKDIIELLDSIPEEYLKDISLTNYCEMFVENPEAYSLPYCKDEDKDKVMEFYDKFMISRDNNERKELIKGILEIVNRWTLK